MERIRGRVGADPGSQPVQHPERQQIDIGVTLAVFGTDRDEALEIQPCRPVFSPVELHTAAP